MLLILVINSYAVIMSHAYLFHILLPLNHCVFFLSVKVLAACARSVISRERKIMIYDIIDPLQALFPDTIYSLDSGGDPKVIPQLTFEEFKVYYAFSTP